MLHSFTLLIRNLTIGLVPNRSEIKVSLTLHNSAEKWSKVQFSEKEKLVCADTFVTFATKPLTEQMFPSEKTI